MNPSSEYDWQRDTSFPSARALLSFLETDMENGMRLVKAVLPKLIGQQFHEDITNIERLHTDVVRWMNCARRRRIGLGTLPMRVLEFSMAVETVRRSASQM